MIDYRVANVFDARLFGRARKTDRLFGYLFVFQWILGVVFAFTISPQTWDGAYAQTHVHVYAATLLGGLIAGLPIYLILTDAGATINRMVIAVSQLLFSILLIHLTGGRIETHFHIFGSLAFLAFYRDWRPVAIGTAITAADHLLRGALWPQSVYGVLSASPWRALEHTAWVAFEGVFLFYSIFLARRELHIACISHVKLEETIETIEDQVHERTRELFESRHRILDQQQALVSTSKMSALGEMAGGIAHEINNPLATIKSLSSQLRELLEETPIDRVTVNTMATVIEESTDRIAKVVQSLRAFARDGAKDPVAEINVHKLVDDTLTFCRERFKSGQTMLHVEPIREDLIIEGREIELSQVLLNLLGNAHDAVANLHERWIRVEVLESLATVDILVTDSGPGIAPELHDKIFQPFFTTKEIGKGTGTGLSISTGLIEKHGGSLTLNVNNPHTCFVIRLPKTQDAIAA